MKKSLALILLMLCNIVSIAQTINKFVIFFTSNKSVLTWKATKKIDSTFHSNKNLLIDSVIINAYCDSIGSSSANDLLSLKRAGAVKAYLLQKKLADSTLIEMKGFGRRNPLNNNSTEALRALNRRAEIVIYAKPAATREVKQTASFADTIKAGEKFRLRNLNFFGGRHVLLPSSKPVLDSLVTILNQYPSMHIEIQGYICCMDVGVDGFDFDTGDPKLSVARAKTVYDYLVSKGIDSTRLTYKGFGSRPIVPERSEEDRRMNRRVEIKVLTK
jgi:outer membrane protein OmpA-like peptidoglycan-associated protein